MTESKQRKLNDGSLSKKSAKVEAEAATVDEVAASLSKMKLAAPEEQPTSSADEVQEMPKEEALPVETADSLPQADPAPTTE